MLLYQYVSICRGGVFGRKKKVREAKIKYFKNCVHSKNIILILNICKIWQSIYLKLIAKNSFTLILQKN